MEQAGVALIAQGASAYFSDMKTATSATNAFVDATDKGSGRVSAAGQVIIGGLREIGKVTVDVFGKALKATAAFIGDSIGLAGDFEAQMLSFQAVAGKDVDTKGLEQFRDMFLDIGKRLPVSTADVQKAAIELVKGGIDPATIAAGGLESSIKFAAAAMDGDLVGAAEISAKIVGGWADVTATAAQKADLLTHSQDVLTKAANASTVGVQDLSLGLFNVQGNAKAAGMGLDETVQALALLSPNFSSAATAGTSLNAMITRLTPSTKPAIAAMSDLGLYTEETGSVFYDAQGSFIGWEQTAQILQDTIGGLTDVQKQERLETIFGIDAMGAAAELTRQGAAGWDQMTDALTRANGVAENAALKQQGLNTAMENAKGSVEALQITIGSVLLPVLTDLINNVVAPAINTLTDMADAVFGNDEAFNRLSPTAQAVVSTLDVLIAGVQDVVGAFDDAGAMSSEFGESIGGLAGDLGLPGELIQDIVFAVQDLVSWFNKAGSETNALDAVMVDLADTWDNVLYTVEDVAAGYMAIVQSVLPIITRFVDEHGAEISAFMKTTWDSIIQIVNMGLAIYNSIVPPVLNAIAGFISDHGSEITKILSGVWEVISSLITGALDTIKGVFAVALAVINGDWAGAWGGIKDIANAQITAIGGVIEGFLDMIAGLFDTSMADILQMWEDNWNMAIEIVQKIDWIEAGQSVVEGIIKGVSSMAGELFAALEQMAQDAYDAFMAKIKGASPAQEFVPAGQSMVQGIMLGLQNQLPALKDLVSSMADDLIDQVKDIGEQINGVIADSFGATASIDRQVAKNLDSMKNVLPAYQQYAAGALKAAQQEAEAFADPAEGAKYFQMRSKQILEYEKLRKDLADTQQSVGDTATAQAEEAAKADDLRAQLALATTDAEREAILKKLDASQKAQDAMIAARHEAQALIPILEKQMLLIYKAQEAERSQFNANKAANGNPLQDLIDQINQLFNNSKKADLEKQYAAAKTDEERARIKKLIEAAAIPVNDTGVGHDLQVLIQLLTKIFNVPGVASGGPVDRGQPYWVGEDGPELFWPQTQGTVSPAASSAQMAARGNQTNYNGQVGNTYNMPVYTNNTQGAIQQSWAIMQASMP